MTEERDNHPQRLVSKQEIDEARNLGRNLYLELESGSKSGAEIDKILLEDRPMRLQKAILTSFLLAPLNRH